jgi:hypothetical protein
MDFHGRLANLEGKMLFLQSGDGTGPVIGIPLGEIEHLLPVFLPDKGPELLLELEPCAPLLELFPGPVLDQLVDPILAEAERWSWQDAYRWASRLEEVLKSPGLRLHAQLVKCRALYRMGHYEELDRLLDALSHTIPPLAAPPLLCWLNAERFSLSGHSAEAEYWASLPALQIPALQPSINILQEEHQP